MTPHPAKFSTPILAELRRIIVWKLPTCAKILDPFAGVGTLARMADELGLLAQVTGVEIEPEWACQHPSTIVGDAMALPFADETFDAVVTSPAYGNRMADAYAGDAKGSKRFTYRTALLRGLSDGNLAALQWTSPDYRKLHRIAWTEAVRTLKDGGLFVLNVSDHIRKGERQMVSAWHGACLQQVGLTLETVTPVQTRRMKNGQNGEKRVECEYVVTLRKGR